MILSFSYQLAKLLAYYDKLWASIVIYRRWSREITFYLNSTYPCRDLLLPTLGLLATTH